MRYHYLPKQLNLVFEEIRSKSGLTFNELGKKYKVTARTIYGWRKGQSYIPSQFIEFAEGNLKIKLPQPDHIFTESEIKSRAGRLGGRARIVLHGNPGTSHGRIKGGRKAIETMRARNIKYFFSREVKLPSFSEELAEFVGILLGDGGITERQLTITLHKIDDKKYSEYVAKLIEKMFETKPSIRERRNKNALDIQLSRTNIILFLIKMGLTRGNKVKNQIGIPDWIKANPKFTRACLRGLFDTDGCFYIDRHLLKNKLYSHGGIAFSNRSLPILNFWRDELLKLGIAATNSAKYLIFVRRKESILKYFKEVGSSNPKHLNKFLKFYRMEGCSELVRSRSRKAVPARAWRFKSSPFRQESKIKYIL